jgi:general secretion pathway protein E
MVHREIEHITPEDLPKIPIVIEGISARFIRENRVIPIEQNDKVLKVVLPDPPDRSTIDALSVAVPQEVVVYVTEPEAVSDYIAKFYSQEQKSIDQIIEEIDQPESEAYIEEEDVEHLMDLASEAPIIKLVNTIIAKAIESRASDIHVEPFEDELKVRYRIDGVLHQVESLPKKLQPAIVSRIKLTSKINIAERRLPQDGGMRIKMEDKQIDFRVSTIPVQHGESIVIRILDREGIRIELESLGFSRDKLSDFKSLIDKPNGIVLVTGPTGSGKTTTLYGALEKINSPDKKIITVEDPVEYQLKGINQIQVQPKIDLSFPNILRHIVRQDPDIILIGEIRDLETAEIAIQSALTGHLVFSTLHTNDAPSAITRLVDMGVESYLIATTVRGILAQRLIRVICPSCKAATNSEEARAELSMLKMDIGEEFTLYRGAGCEACSHTGFYGRTGIFELLLVDDEVRKLMLKNADSGKIRDKARKRGMKTLMEDGIDKVKRGISTVSEVLRVTQE